MVAHEATRSRPGGRAEGARTGLLVGLVAFWASGLAAQQDPPPFDYDQAGPGASVQGAYGYVRTLDGSATLVQPGGERVQVRTNEPVLVGDRLFVSGDSKAEILLADRNLVRLGRGGDLGFIALANSADANDPTTILDLSRGTAQIVVVRERLGQGVPTVRTPNASIEFTEPGLYLVVVDSDQYSEVVVREGRAEVRTESDGAEVRQGEALFVDGGRNAAFQFAAAPSLDDLEAWGDGLDEYSAGRYAEYVDDDLQYAAAPLAENGTWVAVGASWAWRPYVSVGWAPYRHGRWRYTPTGWFWVSYDPWGWVPHHYGYWDYHYSWGWVWYPGYSFAPAHVYFYWGAGGYAGWCPTGYYVSHYGPYYGSSWGYYNGVYGYARGSSWYDKNRYWTFARTDRLGHRNQHIYALSGEELSRRGHSLGRGVITTDTRELRPDVWRRPGEGLARLTRQAGPDGRELGDATPFADRSDGLSSSLERVTLRDRSGTSRVAATDTRSSGGVAGRAVGAGRTDEAGRAGVETATPVNGRPTIARDATGAVRSAGRAPPTTADVRTSPASPDATLRRPGSASGQARAADPTIRRPELGRDAAGTARSTGRSAADVRTPEVRSRSTTGATLRRPTGPVTESSRPTVRSSGSRSTLRSGGSSGATASRPTVRSSGSSGTTSDRATLRSSSSRPTVGSSGATTRSRPTVRSSGSSSRPTVRSSGNSSRPTVRSSGTSSRPTVRSSGGSRPTVRSSGASRSGPAVRGSSGPSRSSGASRSSGPSRSSGATRSSGPSRSSGASRSSGRSGGSRAGRAGGRGGRGG